MAMPPSPILPCLPSPFPGNQKRERERDGEGLELGALREQWLAEVDLAGCNPQTPDPQFSEELIFDFFDFFNFFDFFDY